MLSEPAIGSRLRGCRERAALTQEGAVGHLGVPRELVSMWETEARQPARAQVAALYRVPASYLTDGTPPLAGVERALVCRTDDEGPTERVANTFGPHFLFSRKKLREMVERLGGPTGGPIDAYKAVHLASSFRVCYPTTLRRLLTERHVNEGGYERLRWLSPQGLAARVGVDAAHFRTGEPAPLGLDCYPLSVLRTEIGALRERRLTTEDVAGALVVEPALIEAELVAEPPSASQDELREFHELP